MKTFDRLLGVLVVPYGYDNAGNPGASAITADNIPAGTTNWMMNASLATNFTVYATGTSYNLTATPALLGFGTITPSVTIAIAGTYAVKGTANFTYSGATYAGSQTATIKLRRTNNTPADLPNGSRTATLRIITSITDGAGVNTTPEVIYTASAGDVIQLFGSVSATPSLGNVVCDSAEIICKRLY